MSRRNRKAKRRAELIPVWTYDQIHKALPYLSSVMRSAREHRLDAQTHDRHAGQLANRPGRPDRATLIDHEEALQTARHADERFHEALEELHSLGIYCLDPVRGEALVPFAHQEQLAWFIFDLFDPDQLQHWRFHTDPLETRHPITDAQKAPPALPKAA